MRAPEPVILDIDFAAGQEPQDPHDFVTLVRVEFRLQHSPKEQRDEPPK